MQTAPSMSSPDPVGPAPAGSSQRRAIRVWTAALIVVSAGMLWLQFRQIDSTLPYPRHVDEEAISSPAARVLVHGSFAPSNFNYPTLPTYLAAGGMAAGFLRAAGRMEIREVQAIGSVGFPYYKTRRVMQGARQLFALLSVIAFIATGVSAWLVLRRPVLILLAPLILLTSFLFFNSGWTYLNVDIVGTCCVALTMATCLAGTRRPSIVQSAVLPGVMAGLATGTKYSLAVVVLPVLLAIGFHFTGAQRRWAWAAALTAMVAAFVAVVPYSLLDLPLFLNGVGFDLFHYASGHAGFNAQPGLSQFMYYARHFAIEFGAAGVALALVGLLVCTTVDWRRAAVMAIFPVALLWLLAGQRVHFTRNVLCLHPFVAMFAAFGLVGLHGWVHGLIDRAAWVPRPIKARGRVVVGLVLLAATVPLWHVADHFRDWTDSRNRAQAWIEARLPSDWTVVVPAELGFDPQPLEAAGRRAVTVSFQSVGDAGALNALLRDVPRPAAVLVPRWGADSRFKGQERAAVLNTLMGRWRVVESFGSNGVLVNYVMPVPFGDPAFAVAVLP